MRVLASVLAMCAAGAATDPLRVHGLVAATLTPFDASGAVAGAVVEQQAAWLQKTGVRWVFVSGTTGESVKLSFEERKQQAERWIAAAPKYNISVIVHVGTDSIVEAKQLAAHAVAHGAHAVGWMPPVFFKPANTDALAATLKAVADSAPGIPFYYYHIPSMTGVQFAMLDLVKSVEKVGVETFAGVKYTGLYTYPGFMDASRVAAFQGGKYEVLGGREDMMVESVAAGITGFVGSQFNYLGDLYNSLRGLCMANNMTQARSLQLAATDFIARWSEVPQGVDGMKNVFNAVNAVQIGDARLPAVPISASTLTSLRATIKDWCSGKVAAGLPYDTLLCQAARAA